MTNVNTIRISYKDLKNLKDSVKEEINTARKIIFINESVIDTIERELAYRYNEETGSLMNDIERDSYEKDMGINQPKE